MHKKLSFRARIAITRRGFGILKTYCPGLAEGKAAAAFITALQPFATLWLSAQLINEISGARRIQVLAAYASAAVLVNFAARLLRSVFERISNDKEALMWSWFGKIFSDKQMSMDYIDLENAQIQQKRQQAQENLFMFGNGLAQLVWGTTELVRDTVNIFASLALTVGLFAARAEKSPLNSPLWCIPLLLCVILGGLCNYRATEKENRVFERWSGDTVWYNRVFMFFGHDLYMSLERAKDLRIYEQNFIADRILAKLLQKDKKDDAPLIFKMALYPAAARVIVLFANALCYLFVVLKAALGAFGAGDIVRYAGALSRFGEGIQGLMFVLSDNAVYCSHLQKLFDFLDLPNRKDQGTLPIEKPGSGPDGKPVYTLELQHVSFRYPGANSWALHDVSMKFESGKRLAVVGENGSGKTTLIKLLCRLYDPDEGEILLNGINIKEYRYDEYLSVFSVVFQDFQLFSFPLGQNIAADTQYSPQRAAQCLEQAGFQERLAKMPKGLNTFLYRDFENEGVEISGGEAQKIALARALYRDTPFIILDEPTAALDPVSEYAVYSKFDAILAGRTAIYISHRLASCRFCDDIAVFEQGRLIQRGSHAQLLTIDTGKYRQLWEAQAKYYREDNRAANRKDEIRI